MDTQPHTEEEIAEIEARMYRVNQEDIKIQEEYKRYEFKPFGGWNYSYGTKVQAIGGGAFWLAMTAGGLAVDWREAAIVLGVCVYLQEQEDPNMGIGNSWVSNVQAGYLFYKWWARNNQRYLVKWSALFAAVNDSTMYLYDKTLDWELNINHKVHFTGFMEGIVTAFLLDKIFTRKQPLF